ncbi:MAG: hypothetical protein DPW20_17290 [Candidatus Brocadia sp.]|uniref:hypothetical protein n=1 Tax=Candidatus Brocadia sp. AMX2 TaxID=2293635 RepID=UPI000EC09049|nr:hypothetical protein [Candidatus Brocadia sp. AMX2]MCK6468658.1 hypothetical protein [Candidatus Brocadia sinica]MCQ3919091.1 hypothetical protein [Candidatus Brocadia sp.]NOG42455.1 hypothetical protein [Planctomycetota bacterium]NUO04545.1 hypothetical protein [Candidatus Brocadia sinica]RIJ88848.1 MAG: hypothetical protein DB853_16635 [Candidatus Brocadia sp.]
MIRLGFCFCHPCSKAEAVILRIIRGDDTLLISGEIIKEVLEVLSTKFHRDREAISDAAVSFRVLLR